MSFLSETALFQKHKGTGTIPLSHLIFSLSGQRKNCLCPELRTKALYKGVSVTTCVSRALGQRLHSFAFVPYASGHSDISVVRGGVR